MGRMRPGIRSRGASAYGAPLVAEQQQGEYDSSRYASRDAPVTPGHYRGFYEQEPTTGEGGESGISDRRDSQQQKSSRQSS